MNREWKLIPADRKDYSKIRKLYLSAFPSEERAPFFLIKRRIRQGKAEMLVAKQGSEFGGFTYVVTYKKLVYIFFLAVVPERRGEGVGSAILTLLKEKYAGYNLLLAREQIEEDAENYVERVKRREFYMKNGFTDLPARIKEAGVIYDAMSTGGKVSVRDYNVLIGRWSGPLLQRLLDLRMIEGRNDSE